VVRNLSQHVRGVARLLKSFCQRLFSWRTVIMAVNYSALYVLMHFIIPLSDGYYFRRDYEDKDVKPLAHSTQCVGAELESRYSDCRASILNYQFEKGLGKDGEKKLLRKKYKSEGSC
jgi:hypothetical protein